MIINSASLFWYLAREHKARYSTIRPDKTKIVLIVGTHGGSHLVLESTRTTFEQGLRKSLGFLKLGTRRRSHGVCAKQKFDCDQEWFVGIVEINPSLEYKTECPRPKDPGDRDTPTVDQDGEVTAMS